MLQRSRQSRDAAASGDDLPNAHAYAYYAPYGDTSTYRAYVSLVHECAMTEVTLGEKLLRLKERSGLSLANIARAAGYKNASSIQRYFDAAYDAEYLPSKVANRLTEALTGFGDPAIHGIDIEELTEFDFQLKRQSFSLPPHALQRRETFVIECNSTHPTGKFIDEAETFILTEDPVTAFEKDKIFSARRIEGLYVSTSSLSPRYLPGEIAFFELDRPALQGGDVLVVLTEEGTGYSSYILAKFIEQGRETVVLEILTPARRFELDRKAIDVMYPLVQAHQVMPQRNPRDYRQTG